MKTRAQNMIITRADGGAATLTNTHLYAEDGCYLRHIASGEAVGWHIQLGTADSAGNYEDAPTDGAGAHEVPDALPDIHITEEAPVTDAEVDDATALRELLEELDDEA